MTQYINLALLVPQQRPLLTLGSVNVLVHVVALLEFLDPLVFSIYNTPS